MTFQVSTSFYPEHLILIPLGIMMINQKRWKNLIRLKYVLLVNTFVLFFTTGSNSTISKNMWYSGK